MLSGRTVARPRRQAENVSALDDKMIGPGVSTRIEQCRDSARIGIDTREVRPFVSVVAVAGESEAAGIAGATVLLRYDVFDMETHEGCRLLRHAAILTRVASTPSNNLP